MQILSQQHSRYTIILIVGYCSLVLAWFWTWNPQILLQLWQMSQYCHLMSIKEEMQPDREKWLVTDENERKQHFETEKTFKQVPGDRSGVPRGHKVLPLKRHCKIRYDGTFKDRWLALSNRDDFTGDKFSSTITKKVLWLFFLSRCCWAWISKCMIYEVSLWLKNLIGWYTLRLIRCILF